MPSTNLIIFAVLILVGLRAIWQGVRGLQGRQTVRYGLLTGLLFKRLAPEEQGEADQTVLKVGSIMRLIFGLIIAGMGTYSLIIELSR